MSKLYETYDKTQEKIYGEENDEEIIPLKIKDETNIIYYYDRVETEYDLDLVYDAILTFDIERKISDYREIIYGIYKNVVEKFINDEAPTHIFDTGLHNDQMTKFIM